MEEDQAQLVFTKLNQAKSGVRFSVTTKIWRTLALRYHLAVPGYN